MGVGIEFSATNLFKFLGLLTPFLIIFFLLMSSVINQDLKVLIYLLGTSIASLVNIFFMNLIKSRRNPQESSGFCNVFTFPFTTTPDTSERYDTPSMSSMFISFTLAYLWLPMMFNPPNTVNIPLVLSLSGLLVVDIMAQHNQRCTNFLGSFLGTLVGFVMGASWYGLLNSSGYQSLLYYSDFTGNKTICSRPKKEYFKCGVYKNGKLLQSTRM